MLKKKFLLRSLETSPESLQLDLFCSSYELGVKNSEIGNDDICEPRLERQRTYILHARPGIDVLPILHNGAFTRASK